MLTKVHSEGVHFPQKPSWSAEEMESFQTFLVCCKSTFCALVSVEVSILVAFPTLVWSLNLLELVRLCSFRHLTFGLVLIQVWLSILRITKGKILSIADCLKVFTSGG